MPTREPGSFAKPRCLLFRYLGPTGTAGGGGGARKMEGLNGSERRLRVLPRSGAGHMPFAFSKTDSTKRPQKSLGLDDPPKWLLFSFRFSSAKKPYTQKNMASGVPLVSHTKPRKTKPGERSTIFFGAPRCAPQKRARYSPMPIGQGPALRGSPWWRTSSSPRRRALDWCFVFQVAGDLTRQELSKGDLKPSFGFIWCMLPRDGRTEQLFANSWVFRIKPLEVSFSRGEPTRDRGTSWILLRLPPFDGTSKFEMGPMAPSVSPREVRLSNGRCFTEQTRSKSNTKKGG